MKTMKFSMIFAALAAVLALTALPAEAAKKKKQEALEQPTRTIYYTSSGRRVVVVHPRSYLDPGTEVLPGERKYNDYAQPPGYFPFIDRSDYRNSSSRMPFPDCFDLASMCR
jgi:hypothetical protein